MMKVSIGQLLEAHEIIAQHLKSEGLDEVEIEYDYYWYFDSKERYNPYAEPAELFLGQLSDDWNEVQRIVSGETEPLGYALVWMSALLRAIGEKHVA